MPVPVMVAQFKAPSFGKKSATKPISVKKGTQALKKSSTPRPGGGTQRLAGGKGYRKYAGDALWLPAIQRPAWLDGSLPGDRGFDPLGLGKPTEYLQVGLDQDDFEAYKNEYGTVTGKFDVDAE